MTAGQAPAEKNPGLRTDYPGRAPDTDLHTAEANEKTFFQEPVFSRL